MISNKDERHLLFFLINSPALFKYPHLFSSFDYHQVSRYLIDFFPSFLLRVAIKMIINEWKLILSLLIALRD